MAEHRSIQQLRGKCILPVYLGRVLTIFYAYLSSV